MMERATKSDCGGQPHFLCRLTSYDLGIEMAPFYHPRLYHLHFRVRGMAAILLNH